MTIVMLQDHVTVWSVLEVPPCAKPESFIVWPTNHIVTFTSAYSIGSVFYFVRLWLLLLLVWLTSWMGSKITAQCGIIRQLVQRDLCQIGELVLFSLYCSIFQPAVLSDDNSWISLRCISCHYSFMINMAHRTEKYGHIVSSFPFWVYFCIIIFSVCMCIIYIDETHKCKLCMMFAWSVKKWQEIYSCF